MRLQFNQAPIAAAILISSIVLGGNAMAGPGVVLDPHRAVYDLSLESRTSNSSVETVRGRMVHEFTGTPCEGYAVSMRWVAQMGDSDGDVDVDDVRLASFEDGSGDSYTYTSTRFLNDKKVEEVKAHAQRGAGQAKGEVVLTKPAEEKVALPARTVFPISHLRHVIEAAIAGETFAEETVYDVSENGRYIYNTLAVVGARRSAGRTVDAADVPGAARLKDMRSWPVTISYFKGEADGEETPAFEQTFDLVENGVAVNLRLDYGEIVIKGTLSDLEFLAAPACEGRAATP